jgi:RNA polymerase sigma factor (sigma-70 family)
MSIDRVIVVNDHDVEVAIVVDRVAPSEHTPVNRTASSVATVREQNRCPVDVADSSRPIDQQLIDGWMDGRLRQALKQLPPSYRMIVVMREIEGLPTKDVAAIAGVSESNVKTRLHRARLMLRKQLERV